MCVVVAPVELECEAPADPFEPVEPVAPVAPVEEAELTPAVSEAAAVELPPDPVALDDCEEVDPAGGQSSASSTASWFSAAVTAAWSVASCC